MFAEFLVGVRLFGMRSMRHFAEAEILIPPGKTFIFSNVSVYKQIECSCSRYFKVYDTAFGLLKLDIQVL